MNLIEIKCYLLPANVNNKPTDEMITNSTIRKFSISNDMDFVKNLVEKIQNVFGNVVPADKNEIKTYYLDNEKELIWFSEVEEISEILENGYFKVYTKSGF